MSEKTLGRLEKVDLREFWINESSNFTPWLAQPENLKLLGETIEIDLECESQEKGVGPFRADILCKDLATDNWVLIENQLERTDHTHLGQLLTYAAGLEAVTIVWLAQRFTDEHRAALDWLNEYTDEKINFFGLEVELWRIGNSPAAPKFNIVSKPNDWTRSVKDAAESKTSPHKAIQLQFWTTFRDYMEEHSPIRCQKPSPRHYMNHSIGKSGIHLSSVASMWNSETGTNGPEIRVELVLQGNFAKQNYSVLEKRRQEIETDIGEQLKWRNPEEANMCRIYTRINANFLDSKLWKQQHEWLRNKLEVFYKVFSPLTNGLE